MFGSEVLPFSSSAQQGDAIALRLLLLTLLQTQLQGEPSAYNGAATTATVTSIGFEYPYATPDSVNSHSAEPTTPWNSVLAKQVGLLAPEPQHNQPLPQTHEGASFFWKHSKLVGLSRGSLLQAGSRSRSRAPSPSILIRVVGQTTSSSLTGPSDCLTLKTRVCINQWRNLC